MNADIVQLQSAIESRTMKCNHTECISIWLYVLSPAKSKSPITQEISTTLRVLTRSGDTVLGSFRSRRIGYEDLDTISAGWRKYVSSYALISSVNLFLVIPRVREVARYHEMQKSSISTWPVAK